MAEMKKNGSEDEFSVDEPDEEVGSDSDGSWNEDDEKRPGRGRAVVARGRGGAGGGGGGRGRGKGRGRGAGSSEGGTKRTSKGGGGAKAKRSKTEDDEDEDDEDNDEEGAEKDEEELDEEEIEDEEEEEDEESESSGGEDDGKDPSKKEFKSGKFVVLKKDLTSGDMPPIWKIDGKVLLQKFMPFEKEGKTLYKSTSTYSGWSHHNREQYRPAPVKLEDEGPNETIVEFLRDSMEAEPAEAAATATSGDGVEAKE
ncbi:hypothetical protein B566_EDAN013459 [Ephemera danica]|nr:hypothetical protein B566_EDAN013459 [Ephemera danica]